MNIFKTFLIDNTYIAVQCVPSKEEQLKMAAEEKERVKKQIEKLGEAGLREKQEFLQKAVEFNEREPPVDMLTSVPIPSLKSINFHTLTRFRSDLKDSNLPLSLNNTPVFTYFDHLKTNFVYVGVKHFFNRILMNNHIICRFSLFLILPTFPPIYVFIYLCS